MHSAMCMACDAYMIELALESQPWPFFLQPVHLFPTLCTRNYIIGLNAQLSK